MIMYLFEKIFCFTGSDGKIENGNVLERGAFEYRSNIYQLLREALCLTSTLDSRRYFATIQHRREASPGGTQRGSSAARGAKHMP